MVHIQRNLKWNHLKCHLKCHHQIQFNLVMDKSNLYNQRKFYLSSILSKQKIYLIVFFSESPMVHPKSPPYLIHFHQLLNKAKLVKIYQLNLMNFYFTKLKMILISVFRHSLPRPTSRYNYSIGKQSSFCCLHWRRKRLWTTMSFKSSLSLRITTMRTTYVLISDLFLLNLFEYLNLF